MQVKYLLRAAAALAIFGLGAFALSGCSQGSNSNTSSTLSSAPNGAAMVVTVGDAPLGNILSAKVTISALSLSSSGANPVTVLSNPQTIELSGLGAIQEPIETQDVAAGTYSAANVTVSSAVVTYVDSTGNIVTGTAAIASPNVTVTFNPALTVTQGQDVHLSLNFNLAQSFDLTGTTLSFTPSITSAAASIESESEAERQVEVTGSVVSISSSSITVQSACTGVQSVFAINSSTQFSQNMTASSITQGSIVTVHGAVQTDGSLLATMISASMNGEAMSNAQTGGRGIVTAVTKDSNGNVTAFTFVPREDFGSLSSGSNVSVTLSSATTYGVNEDAVQQGIAASAFNNAEIFPGQSVQVIGAAAAGGSIAAQEVELAPESLSGTLAAIPQSGASGYTFTLQLPAASLLTVYDSLTTLPATTSAQTEFEDGLSSSSFSSLAAGTAVEVHGYLLLDSSNNYSLTVANISQVEGPDH